jgi:AcrR family transcriptional regulator
MMLLLAGPGGGRGHRDGVDGGGAAGVRDHGIELQQRVHDTLGRDRQRHDGVLADVAARACSASTSIGISTASTKSRALLQLGLLGGQDRGVLGVPRWADVTAGEATAGSGGERRAMARRRILDAAVRRIAREGIDGVRIARVANDAGVSAALVHYHFASRDALLVEALEHSYELAGDVRIGEEDASPVPAAVRLAAMIDACLPAPGAQHDDFLLWIELWLRAARQPELQPVAARLYARLHEWFAEVVEAGIAAGELTCADPAEAVDRLLALIDGYGVRVLMGDPSMPTQRARAAIWRGVAHELGVDAGV